MKGVNPTQPQIREDELGEIVKRAWESQEAVGWVHLAQGRFSKLLGEAQGLYYQMNPDLKVKKHLTGLNWAKVMIGALIDMSLAMWNNRCDSLHGKSEEEKVQKKKDK